MRVWLRTVSAVLAVSLLGAPSVALACAGWCLDGSPAPGHDQAHGAPVAPEAPRQAHADEPAGPHHQPRPDASRHHDHHGTSALQSPTAQASFAAAPHAGPRASVRGVAVHGCTLSSELGPAVRQAPRASVDPPASCVDAPLAVLPAAPIAYVAAPARPDGSPPPVVYRAPLVLRI